MGTTATTRNKKGWLVAQTLTAREAEILAAMAAFPEETLVYERGKAYFGLTPVAARTVFSLVRKIYVSPQSRFESMNRVEHYAINEDGARALARRWGLDVRKELRPRLRRLAR